MHRRSTGNESGSVNAVLRLARQLRGRTDEDLARLIGRRGVKADGPLDFFDLAQLLSSRHSIERALRRTTRPDLAVLAVLAQREQPSAAKDLAAVLEAAGWRDDCEAAEDAARHLEDEALLLAEPDGLSPLPGVAQQMADWPEHGLPDAAALCAQPAPPEVQASASPSSAGAAQDAAAAASPRPEPHEVVPGDTAHLTQQSAQAAFACIGLAAELAGDLLRHPVALRRGKPTSSSLRRLGALLDVPTEDASALVRLLLRSGLVEGRDQQLRGDDARIRAWLAGTASDRWRDLAAAWQEGLPSRVWAILTRAPDWRVPAVTAYAAWLYPAAGRGLEAKLAAALDEARILGLLLERQGRDRTAERLFASGAQEAAEALAAHFPHPVDTVYVQEDFTIIAPGPLRSDLDARMREFCLPEGHRLASSYRVTEESVSRAVGAGSRAADLLGFLSGVSVSGIPQPLEYLIAETAERYGRIRVGTRPGRSHPGSLVHSQDETLLRTIEVDRALRGLGLRPTPEGLVSEEPPKVVLAALIAGRYPAAADSEAPRRHPSSGDPVTAQAREPSDRTVAPDDAGVAQRARPRAQAVLERPTQGGSGSETTPEDGAHALVLGLRQAEEEAGADLERLWIGRVLAAAAQAKSEVGLSVRVPGGGLRDFRLEVTGVSAQRVRGRDVTADVERTLPLASIESLLP